MTARTAPSSPGAPSAPSAPTGTSGPRRRVAARAALCAAVLLAPALLAPAWPAAADSPAPSAPELPALAQTLPDVRENGCRKPSTRAADRTPWAQVYLHPEAAWPFGRGAGVTVAVLGSGVEAAAGTGSGALAGRLRLGPRLHGQGDAGRDCVGHGTFLAALVAGRRTPDGGPAGIAPEATVLAVAVTDDAGTTTPDLLAQGIRAAADGGARVAVVGVPVPAPNQPLAEAVEYAAAKGVLLVAPAAADGQQEKGAVYPAGFPGVLAVAAVGPGGSAAGGSASGDAGTGAQAAAGARVDLAAPGEALQAAGPGGGHFTSSGPSGAAALVAGVAALVLSREPALTAAQVAERLRSTAYRPGTTLPDPAVGWGTVDVVAATAALPAPQSTGGPGNAAGPVTVPPAPDGTSVTRASALAGASAGLVAVVALTAAAVRSGRRRAGGAR
ncbi:S8 family serine peptidase [Kitasatospora sp. NPDC057015]|uniref:S8 family serine peptidase n=1 Tax=Kitasatospora sp. NPDC057015 TaxID=3346001 RepID=UPI00363EAAC7